MSKFNQLIEEVKLKHPSIVAVDGDLGVGKTTIANQLSTFLQWPCLHLDSYLLRGKSTFVPSIQYKKLYADLKIERGPIIIEGLCVLAVLKRISVVPDYLIFVIPEIRARHVSISPILKSEVGRYFSRYGPRTNANSILSLEDLTMSSSYYVDIAYIKYKTILSVTLALGGLAQTIVGAFLINTGLNDSGTATLKIMGAEISATGLGAVVLCTSVLWAYFSYLSRPKYSRRSETTSTSKPDGSSEWYEFSSATQKIAGKELRERFGEDITNSSEER